MKWSIPKRLAKNVFVLAVAVTTSSFGFTDAEHPAAVTAVAVQVARYVNWKLRFEGMFAAAYEVAVEIAVAAVGRSWAPASAAASVALCSCRFA